MIPEATSHIPRVVKSVSSNDYERICNMEEAFLRLVAAVLSGN